MAGHIKPIPMPVILAAISGDEIALAAMILHYRGYIHVLATRPLKDDYGNERLCIDKDMQLRLEAKLIYAIITGFKYWQRKPSGQVLSPFLVLMKLYGYFVKGGSICQNDPLSKRIRSTPRLCGAKRKLVTLLSSSIPSFLNRQMTV